MCGLLLQMMEDGVLTDIQSRTISFKNTIVVMTSNLGENCGDGFGFLPDREQTTDVLCSHFSPEFLGGIDEVAIFHPLSLETLAEIAGLQLEAFRARAAASGISLKLESGLCRHLAEKAGTAGAREIRRQLCRQVEEPLPRFLLLNPPGHKCVAGTWQAGKIQFVLEEKKRDPA